MTRIKILLAVLCTAAIIAMVPVAHAQEQACLNAGAANGTAATCEVHVVGDGSSAQFLQAAVGADALALSVPGVVPPSGCTANPGDQTTFHWSLKNGASIIDTRAAAINPQTNNVWIVWLAACSDPTGATNITDIWTDVSEDSTVGVRTFYAQENANANPNCTPDNCGAQIAELEAGGTASGNLISPVGLWPDDTADVALPGGAGPPATNPIGNALGTSTSPTATSNLYVNVGLTDIRPEDALFATSRSDCAPVNATLTCLGYTSANAQIGANIDSFTSAGKSAQPVNFGIIAGAADPVSGFDVRPSVTIPVGAAPVVFVFNNAGSTYYPIDVETGVEPYEKGPSTDKYPLSELFGGTAPAPGCTNTASAFDVWYDAGTTTSTAPAATPITVILREPLSGTMNTAEFNLFRTFGNPNGSQEAGIGNPLVGAPANPLNLPCANGGGNRVRSTSTSQVVSAISSTNNSVGYLFYSFVNASTFNTSHFNYLTVDGVDPIGEDPYSGDFNQCQGGTAPNNDGNFCASTSQCVATGAGGVAGSCSAVSNIPQYLPVCTGPCPVGYYAGGFSFPNLRNGTYKPWSLYRWVVQSDIENEADVYGPAHLAYATNNVVDSTDADFVPFAAGYTCGGVTPAAGGQYCYNANHCALGVQCLPYPGAIPDSLEVYRSHRRHCTSYAANPTSGDGLEVTCAAANYDTAGNGPASVDYALGGTGFTCQGGTQPNNDGNVCQNTNAQCTATGAGGVAGTCQAANETGSDVGGLVVGPLTPPTQWCPFLSKKLEEVKVTPGSTTVTWDAGFLYGPVTAADGTAQELNLNLVPGNTIYIDGADYVIASVAATVGKTLTIDRPYFTDNGGTAEVTVQACFELNWPGPIGLYN